MNRATDRYPLTGWLSEGYRAVKGSAVGIVRVCAVSVFWLLVLILATAGGGK